MYTTSIETRRHIRVCVDKSWYFFTANQIEIHLKTSVVERASEIASSFIGVSNVKQFKRLVKELNEFFAIIVKTENQIYASVDHLRSIPVVYSIDENQILVGQYSEVSSRLRFEPNISACKLLLHAGFVIGNQTGHGSVKQLLPGSLLAADEAGVSLENWFEYIPRPDNTLGYDHFSRRLSSEIEGLFARMHSVCKDRPIAIPLSGGWDSRLILVGATIRNLENIKVFTYGSHLNHECKTALKIGKALNIHVEYVKTTHKEMRDFYESSCYEKYLQFANTMTCVPVVHELLAIQKLLEKGYLSGDEIVINGQSGDFITGGHIEDLFESRSTSISNLIAGIQKKFIALWAFGQSDEDGFKNLILKNLASVRISSHDQLLGIYENFEWKTRQGQYVSSNQRVYEFFGFDWYLPLWDKDFCSFWMSVPYKLKFKQRLYKDFLKNRDFFGIWGDEFFLERDSGNRSIEILRSTLKFGFAPVIGKKNWKKLDHRFFYYFRDIQGKIAVVKYIDVILCRKKWRNSISWLSRDFLKRVGVHIED